MSQKAVQQDFNVLPSQQSTNIQYSLMQSSELVSRGVIDPNYRLPLLIIAFASESFASWVNVGIQRRVRLSAEASYDLHRT